MKTIKIFLLITCFSLGMMAHTTKAEAYSSHTCYNGLTGSNSGGWLAFSCSGCKQIRCESTYTSSGTCSDKGDQ